MFLMLSILAVIVAFVVWCAGYCAGGTDKAKEIQAATNKIVQYDEE